MAILYAEPGTAATQDLSLWASSSTSSGTIATDTTYGLGGNARSLKAAITAAGGSASVTSPTVGLTDAGTRISALVIWGAGTPGSFNGTLAADKPGSGFVFTVELTNTRVLRLKQSSTTSTGTTVINAGQVYRVCLAYLVENSTHWTANLYLDGMLEASLVNAGTMDITGATAVTAGIFNSTPGNTDVCPVWIGPITIETNASLTDLGPTMVTAKRPNANGALNEWTTQIGAGGSGYGSGHSPQVNEQPLSNTNGWSMQNAAKKTEVYTVEDATTGDINLGGSAVGGGSTVYLGHMGWVRTKVGVNSTGNIIVDGTATNISVTTSEATFVQMSASTDYPSGTSAIGMDTNTVNQLFSLYECGIVSVAKVYATPHRVGLPARRQTRFIPPLGGVN